MLKFTELKNSNRVKLRDRIPLDKPFTVLIEPISLCNFKCVQCFQNCKNEVFNKLKRSMTTIEFSKIIEDIKTWEGDKIKVLKLNIYGEPLLNKNICEMLKIARKAEIADRIEITTNLSLLNKDMCKDFIEYKLDYIRVSVYSAYDEKYKKITSSEFTASAMYEKLKMIKEMKLEYNSDKPFTAAKMLDTYDSENEAFKEKFKDISGELYIEKPHNWISENETQFIEKLYKEKTAVVMDDLNKKANKNKACTMPFFTLAVRSNGDVSPCCNDWLNNTKIGNAFEQPIYDIWKGDALYNFHRMQLLGENYKNPSCANCQFYSNDFYILDNIDGVSVEKLKRG
jgi:radical SAM protein with 4Fe4S-binding SPASM domain